ncbi:MAG TPA: peptidoglycan DD-metalloendopeptidase family protein [Ktedonobacterales bacterium]|nr:peptidoglycan DD-metalloendopeptidase family protein [Ktedonobacterales bacterium]
MGRGRSPRDYPENEPFDAHDDDNAYDEGSYDDGASRDLMALDNLDARLPALLDDESAMDPVVIPGSGVSYGTPFIKRRERPLTMRLAVIALMACILVTGLFTITPLGSKADGGLTSFQAVSGAVVWHRQPSFHWYVAAAGDSVESIAAQFHVQIGGIYELNNMLAGQEIDAGKAYKIPDDPYYGADYRPGSYIPSSGRYGATTYGNSPWTSLAGNPVPEQPCGPDGHGVFTAYQLVSPNPGSVWVRGFTWYHNGVDIAAPAGNPIHAAQAGEVIWAGWDVGGLGWSVKINNCNGISTIYGHMEKLLVSLHTFVGPGATIGLEGSTGWSTGPHLHFMVLENNVPADPFAFYGYNTAAITGH